MYTLTDDLLRVAVAARVRTGPLERQPECLQTWPSERVHLLRAPCQRPDRNVVFEAFDPAAGTWAPIEEYSLHQNVLSVAWWTRGWYIQQAVLALVYSEVRIQRHSIAGGNTSFVARAQASVSEGPMSSNVLHQRWIVL